ncbi:MAG: FHA domain-containing protein [Paracoccaceae bacterium]
MLSKRIEPEENPGLDLKDDPLSRLGKPTADDSGRENPSRQTADVDDPMYADPTKPIKAKAEEPEVAGSGWNDADWEDEDWDDDEDWGDEDLDPVDRQKTKDKEMLVSEIREAMGSVSPKTPSRSPSRAPSRRPEAAESASGDTFPEGDDLSRQELARSQLQAFESASADRIAEKTETEMTDHETSRRRSAMAHLKAAAAATKADRVLRHVVSRDPSADPEEQSPYRDDLAKVVRPHSSGRPISRVVSRPASAPAVWDQGEGDEDAALFAAAEEGVEHAPEAQIENELNAAEAKRLAELGAEDFAADDFVEDEVAEAAFEGAEKETPMDNEFPDSRFGSEDKSENAFDAMSDDDFGTDDPGRVVDLDDPDPFDVADDMAPRPSRVVSQAVAFANGDEDALDVPEQEATARKKIWEMADEVASEVEQSRHEEAPEAITDVGAAVSGRAGRSAGRVKTRLLGFQADDGGPKDVFAQNAEKKDDATPGPTLFPAGWIVVISGPGRGSCFTVHTGVSQIGRGEDQAVRLDFGDTSISRNNHAAVAYDDEQGKFFLGHGGKSNLVRLNGMPVLSTEAMSNGDTIRIGETTLKFVAMCGEEFTWSGQGDDAADA